MRVFLFEEIINCTINLDLYWLLKGLILFLVQSVFNAI